MEETVFIKNIDVTKIKYSEPKTLSNGGRTVYINYGGQRLVTQLPWLTLPYGVNDSSDLAAKLAALGKKPEDNKPRTYDLNLSFRGSDSNPKIQQALDKLKEIEQTIINAAFENRESWLRDDYDGLKNVVAKLFTPIIKYDKDKNTGKVVGKYPPTMKIKVPYNEKNDKFTFDCEDKDGVEIEDFKSIMNELKGGKSLVVIQLSGLWFAAGKFGCTWKLMRGRFQSTIQGKVPILVDSDDDNDNAPSEKPSEEDDVAADAAAAAKAAKINATVIGDSDEEDAKDPEDPEDPEEEDSDDEPPPPPPPPAATKKGSKAKK